MSNFSVFGYFSMCFLLPSTKSHTVAFVLVNVPFVLPLCLYILVLGARQVRGGARISHTDFFTYNTVLVQLLAIAGSFLISSNWVVHSEPLIISSIFLISATYTAVIVFQILTCLERYLAVVHPLTYLRLKSQTGIQIRNWSCGCVWLHCVLQSLCLLEIQNLTLYYSLAFFGLTLCLLVVLCCNGCILCVLVRPRPGDGAKGRKTKHKALFMISAIAATLLVRFGGDLLAVLGILFLNEDENTSCALFFSVNWFSLPSSLVLPTLFLQRKGKLNCFKAKK